MNFKGSLLGNANLLIASDNVTFGPTANNSAFTGTIVFHTGSRATVEEGAILTKSNEWVQANGNSTIILNGANALDGGINSIGENEMTFNVNANQNSINWLNVANGKVVLNLGNGVTQVAFANSSTRGWGTGNIVINNFSSGVISFGSDAGGLLPSQLAQISAYYPNGRPVTMLGIDANGFLTAPPDSPKTFYVSALNGDDASNGENITSPFKTISHAVNQMYEGDTCIVREGIYRETVVITSDEVTLEAYPNELVVISGCDLIASTWELHENGTMKTSMTTEVKQLFVNGARQNLARWPNEDIQQNMLSLDEWEASEVTSLTTGSGTVGTARVDFPNMSSMPPDHWVGGYYTGKNNIRAFTAAVGMITDSDANSLTITELAFYGRYGTASTAHGVGIGYIINHLNALDIEKEWVWKDDTLYFHPPAGIDLSEAAVEARTRLWGIDLDGRSNVMINGIQLHAASITMASATDCVVSNCSLRFPAPWSDYYHGHDYGGLEDASCGLYVSGSDNVISNCYIAHSWGSGMRVEGERNTVTDSIITDVNWCGRRMSPVQFYGTNNLLTRCVISEAGRDGVEGGQRSLGFGKYGQHNTITHNRIEHVGRLMGDNGGIYINMQGISIPSHTEIAYNEVLDNHAPHLAKGIYIDNGTSHIKIHHNYVNTGVYKTTSPGIRINDHGSAGQHSIWVINNTVIDSGKEDGVGFRDPDEDGLDLTHDNTWCFNNIHQHGNNLYKGAQSGGNSSDIDSAHFIDAANDDYQLAASSNHIDPVGSTGGVIDNGTNAWRITDPDADNPIYKSGLDASQFQQMYTNGWVFEVVVRAIEDSGAGSAFVGWGINKSSNPGWHIPWDGERVGGMIGIDHTANAFTMTPEHSSTTITLAANSADNFHTIRYVGVANATGTSNDYELFIDGVSYGTFGIADGTSNSSAYRDAIRFGSGSSAGTGRTAYWNKVSIAAGATTIVEYSADAGSPATAQDIESPLDQAVWATEDIESTTTMVFPGINDSYIGTSPDRGAYEYGQPTWTAGNDNSIPPDYTAVDTDGDWLPDLEELAIGFDPINDSDYPQHLANQLELALSASTPGTTVLTFGTTENWLHSIEQTDDLTSGQWTPFICDIPYDENSLPIIIPQVGDALFLRLRLHQTETEPQVVFSDNFDDYSPAPTDNTILNSVSGSNWSSNSSVLLRDNTAEAESGNYYVEFQGTTGGGSMSLNLTTEIGAEYLINFSLSVSDDNAQQPQIDVAATGTDVQLIPVVEPVGYWQYAGYSFTATGTTTVITFTEPNIDTSAQSPRLDSLEIFKLP